MPDLTVKKSLGAVAIAAATGLLTAAVVQAQLTSTDNSAAPALDLSTLPMVTSVPDNEATILSVLRRKQRAGDALDTSATGPYGANLRLARAVDTPGGPLRVVPANGHVCLRGEDNVGSLWTCSPTARVAAQGAVLTSRSQANYDILAVYAVLPDGASDATLSGPTGQHAVSINENVVASAPTDDTKLSFRDSSGTQHTLILP